MRDSNNKANYYQVLPTAAHTKQVNINHRQPQSTPTITITIAIKIKTKQEGSVG